MMSESNGLVLFPSQATFYAISLGGEARSNWPAHGTGDVSTWSVFPATQTVDFATNGILFGGETRTNWPVDATSVGASNAALAVRVTATEVSVTSLIVATNNHSVRIGTLEVQTNNYASYLWVSNQNYSTTTNYDDRYSALGHLHSGTYSLFTHYHTQYELAANLNTNYLNRPTTISTNVTTNYIVYYDSEVNGKIKTRIDAPWSGNVTNWQMVGVSTGEWQVPKLSVGPTTMLRPRLLNLFGTNEAFISQAVYGDIRTFSETNYATVLTEIPGSGVAWQTPGNITDTNYDNYGQVSDTQEPETSKVVRVSTFNFSIPETATILGVKANVVYANTFGNPVFTAQIWNNGYTSGIYQLVPNTSGALTTNTFGSDSSIWGLNSLSAVEVNATDFSIDLQISGNNAAMEYSRVYAIQVEVFYSTESFSWRSGVDSDGRYKIQCDNTGDTPIEFSTNGIFFNAPITWGPNSTGSLTNEPLFSDSPAFGITAVDTNKWSAAMTNLINQYGPTGTATFVSNTLTLTHGTNAGGSGTETLWPAVSNQVQTDLTGLKAATNAATILAGALVAATNALDVRLTAHTTNTANPHATTALQVGAVPTNDVSVTNARPWNSPNYATITNPPTIPSTNGLASTNWVIARGYLTNDTGATNIAAGSSDGYNPSTRTLTWDTNAVSGGGGGAGTTNASGINVAFAPSNYAASAANVEDHLKGIDSAVTTNRLALNGESNIVMRVDGSNVYFGAPDVLAKTSTNSLTVTALQITGGNPSNGAVWIATNTGGQGGWSKPVMFCGNMTNLFYFTNAVARLLTFNQEVYDFGNCWDGTTFTAPVNGFYSFKYAAYCQRVTAGSTVGACYGDFYLNGTFYSESGSRFTRADDLACTIGDTSYFVLTNGAQITIKILGSNGHTNNVYGANDGSLSHYFQGALEKELP
jgi:hypothetical protein